MERHCHFRSEWKMHRPVSLFLDSKRFESPYARYKTGVISQKATAYQLDISCSSLDRLLAKYLSGSRES